MGSPAIEHFTRAMSKADHFILLSQDIRLRPISDAEKQNTLHASLALIVAAWDIYIKHICQNFYSVISNPLDAKYNQLHTISQNHLNNYISRFNTPNAENCRNLLLTNIGYDPWVDWIWIRRSYNSQQTRDYLNELLKVRHSFAHGHSMPSYSWNTSSVGTVRLTIKCTTDCHSFFKFLAAQTDKGLNNFIITNYSTNPHWY